MVLATVRIVWASQRLNGGHEVYLGLEEFLIAEFVLTSPSSVVGVRVIVNMVCAFRLSGNDTSFIPSMPFDQLLAAISIVFKIVVRYVSLARWSHVCRVRLLLNSLQSLPEGRLSQHIVVIFCCYVIILLVV